MAAKQPNSSLVFDPEQITVRRANGVLQLEHNGQTIELAPPKRALPLSSPDEWIVLSSTQGEELGTIRRLAELNPHSREALQIALEEAYRITTILRVLEVEREPLGGQITWRVVVESSEDEALDSHSGRETTFRLAGAEDVQTARYPHIYFSDVDGQRWEIPDCEAMDLASRRASERYF